MGSTLAVTGSMGGRKATLQLSTRLAAPFTPPGKPIPGLHAYLCDWFSKQKDTIFHFDVAIAVSPKVYLEMAPSYAIGTSDITAVACVWPRASRQLRPHPALRCGCPANAAVAPTRRVSNPA